MEDNNQLSFPEEDEDLEALRLAALQSLKRKGNEAQYLGQFGPMTHFNGSPRGKKRGKFARAPQLRPPRNGQFNGWTRNSNLIAVPVITEDKIPEKSVSEVPKLVRPQDRYCKAEESPEKSDSVTTKFDRYDNSDESESESEEEVEKSEEEKSLTRSSSLEALMKELENEIQGVKPEEKPKPKKKRKISVPAPEPEKPEEKAPLKENLKPEVEKKPNFRRKWQKPPRRQPPIFAPPIHQPEILPPVFAPPPVQPFPAFPPIPFDNVYVPPMFDAPPPQLPPMHVAPPPVYERPLSPLSINTAAFSTPILAPLSPRSAAFVMENRAIIEKRKRRSYSRSPSPPRFRRSNTPKRLSLSPRRPSRSPPKRRSLSPSPRRALPRSNSPKKPPVHVRLGVKNEEKKVKKEESKEVDPVLEARRRKFERNEIETAGVIRLKKSEENEEEKKDEAIEEEELDEDALLEGDGEDDSVLLDKIDLFDDDEESDSDNEGRFKTKQENQNQKVAILPFTKLINGAKAEVKNDLKLEEEKKKEEKRRNERRKRFRGRSPLKKDKMKQPMVFPDRKIEIKIRNPAKYERVEEEKEKEKSGRKVEVKKENEEKESEVESPEDAANANISEGDLRAQLSRKRAERQKIPLPDVVPSRLLQNALQGVGFPKGKKSKNKDDTEGKLPIHLRLGAANASEPVGKKRKHKKGSQEQV